ncbi:MAG: hypothetical protein AB7S92_16530 [Parvibaculaceae bacterium]
MCDFGHADAENQDDYALHDTKFFRYFAENGKRSEILSSDNLQGDLAVIQIARRFSIEEATKEYFDKLRWPHDSVCVCYGNADQGCILQSDAETRKRKSGADLYECAKCRQARLKSASKKAHTK